MKTSELIENFFPQSGRELAIGGLNASELADQFGTPLFVYDESIWLRKWETLRSTFPNCFELYYSVKANPNPNILAFFLTQRSGLEIASAGELYQAGQAGCPPDRILYAGPGKTTRELELALLQGVGEIHAESLRELEQISGIAKRLNRLARVAIRVNPKENSQGGAMRMGGKASPFGVDEELLDAALAYLQTQPFMKFQGIHLFSGTQILDAKILLEQYRNGLELARRVVDRLKRPLASLDFGGGLGVPYFANDTYLDMELLRQGLASIFGAIANDPCFVGTRFIVEPGRYLVAEAGVYLSRVLDIKVSRGRKFVVLDGGMNHHLAASGNLGQTIKRNFPMAVVGKLTEAESEEVEVVGPLCTPLDTLGRAVSLAKVEVGDVLAIFQSGAYARAASPLNFLSHPTPPEVLVSHRKARLIRRRGESGDYVVDVQFPPGLQVAHPEAECQLTNSSGQLPALSK